MDGHTCVFSARHMAHVQLVKDLLVDAGIDVRTKNETIASLAGELPMDESRVELWVPDEASERASGLIRETDFEADIGDAWKAAPQ